MRRLFLFMVVGCLLLAGCTGFKLPFPGGPTEGAVCGDKVLGGSEECDIGIACEKAGYVCGSDCLCRPEGAAPNRNLSCANNSIRVAGGSQNQFDSSSYLCKDDCRARDPNSVCDAATCTCMESCAGNAIAALAGGYNVSTYNRSFNSSAILCKDDCARVSPAAVCDPASCLCKIPPGPMPLSCSGNSMVAAWTGINIFNPATMVCKDDCAAVDPTTKCDATCVCVPKKTPVNCAANTKGIAAGNPNAFNPANNICKDDCAAGTACDAKSCTCIKPGDFSCIGNTFSAAFAMNAFDPKAGLACKDDCKTFDPSLACDAQTCTCRSPAPPQNGTLPCATNTLIASSPAGASVFDPSKYKCLDNCKELDASLVCDSESCLCEMPPPLENQSGLSCARNTRPYTGWTLERAPPGVQCRDDCASQFGSDYECNPTACQCLPKNRTAKDVSCADNTPAASDALALSSFFDVFTDVSFSIGASVCKDDCQEKKGSDYRCDPQSCVCIQNPEPASCMQRSLDSAEAGKIEPLGAGMQCRDDCKELDPSLSCDPQSCVCKPSEIPDGTSCARNTYGDLYGQQNAYSGGYCKDDCAGLLGSEYFCEPQTCMCEYLPIIPNAVSCAGNSFVSELGDNNTFDPASMVCLDNCARLDESLTCDTGTCTCVPEEEPPKELDCAGNTFYSSALFSGENIFNPEYTRCVDNCQELADFVGKDLKCDAQTCTCEYSETLSCTGNSFLYGFTGGYLGYNDAQSDFTQGMVCKDDCRELNPDSYCDAQKCVCMVPEKPVEAVSCASRKAGQTAERLPAGAQCKDDCSSLGSGYTCDASSCTCNPPSTVESVSCASRKAGATTAEGMPANAVCKDDCATLGEGYECDTASCTCVPPKGACGDGKTVYPEQCDLGSYETNKCPQGTYCTKDCQCKKLETSVVCGDGKVSSPGEDCDGGNVATNLCPTGYTCRICKCVPTSTVAQCGDSTVTPPEECDPGNSYTEMCPSGLSCVNCRCREPTQTGQTHTECDTAHQECIVVSGAGDSECQTDADCAPAQDCGNGVREGTEQCDGNDLSGCSSGKICDTRCRCITPTYGSCGNGVRDGNEECDGKDLSGCSEGQSCSQDCACYSPVQYYHYECDFAHGACMRVEGQGSSNCQSDADCEPPVLDCPSYCRSQGYGEVVTGAAAPITSTAACKAAASEEPAMCTSLCVYTKFYSKSNQAGTASCCCKAKYTYQCSDCPGQNPQCPQCPDTKPS